MSGQGQRTNDLQKKVDDFIADVAEGDPDALAEKWANELDRMFREELEGDALGFLGLLIARVDELAEGKYAPRTGGGIGLFRGGKEAAQAVLTGAKAVFQRIGNRRPTFDRMLAALFQRHEDLLRRLAVRLGAVGFSVGISATGPTLQLNFGLDITVKGAKSP